MNLNSLITGPARFGLSLAGKAVGAVRGRLGGQAGIDDDTLQQNVEEQVFASRKVSRNKVEVSVTEGVVWLRGEVRAVATIEEVEARAGAVEGVNRVENLLRVAKTPAKPKGQKRPAPTRSAKPTPPAATAAPPTAEPVKPATPPPAEQQERTVTGRFNAERTPADAEPSPRELADAGEGRRPAPFGSEETVGATGAPGRGDSPAAPFPDTGSGGSES